VDGGAPVFFRPPPVSGSQRLNPPLGPFLFNNAVMTPDECHQRAKEAKALAVETRDPWEREMLFKIADQWQLLAAHRATKKPEPALKLIPAKPDTD
jgi:hypothetical protein